MKIVIVIARRSSLILMLCRSGSTGLKTGATAMSHPRQLSSYAFVENR